MLNKAVPRRPCPLINTEVHHICHDSSTKDADNLLFTKNKYRFLDQRKVRDYSLDSTTLGHISKFQVKEIKIQSLS